MKPDLIVNSPPAWIEGCGSSSVMEDPQPDILITEMKCYERGRYA